MPVLHLHRGRTPLLYLALICACSLAVGCDTNQPLSTEPSLSNSFTPAAPSALAASSEVLGQIDLSWQDNSGNEAGFEVSGSTGASGTFSVWTTTGPNATSARFTGLGPGQTFCFMVRAFAKKGQRTYRSAPSNTACATTLSPPPPPPGPNAPSDVTATPVGLNQVRVTWVDNSTDEDWFGIEVSPTTDGPWQFLNHFMGTGYESFTHWNVPSEQQICYRVVAINDGIQSVPSNVDCTAPPAAPGNFIGTNVEGPAIQLTWTDNSAVEDGYEVRRGGPNTPFTVIATLPPGTTGYRDAAVVAGTSYWYLLRAMKDGGYSAYSEQVTLVAGGVQAVPAAPSIISVAGYFLNYVSIEWQVDPATTTSSIVERCDLDTCEDDHFYVVATVPTSGSSMGYMDRAVGEWALVTYRIRGANAIGTSPPSTAVSGRTCIAEWDDMAPCYLPFPGGDPPPSSAWLAKSSSGR